MSSHEGNRLISEIDTTEELRRILSNEQSREVEYDEAADVGESLVSFFEALVGGV